jgi:hypothetical protein
MVLLLLFWSFVTVCRRVCVDVDLDDGIAHRSLGGHVENL